MTTEYRVTLDRATCDGVFACLVRDDRFVESEDGLATLASSESPDESGTPTETERDETMIVATFEDERINDARQAARACPVDAIEVTESPNAVNDPQGDSPNAVNDPQGDSPNAVNDPQGDSSTPMEGSQ